MKKITVIIPTYNQAKYLPKCLESIINQTRKPEEIIVIDDCSIDNTQQMIKKYKNKVKNIRHKKNLGVVKTINDGLTRVTNDYILIFPGDDFLKTKMLEIEATVLDENPQVGLVYSQTISIVYGRQLPKMLNPPAGNSSYVGRAKDFEIFLTRGNFVPFQTALVRKKVYQKLGFWDENLPFLHDWEMWTRIAKHYPLAYVAKPLAYYRTHGENLGQRPDRLESYEKELSYILKKHLLGKLSKSAKKIKKEAYYRFFLGVTSIDISRQQWQRVIENWLQAVKIKPYSIFSWPTIQPLALLLKQILISKIR